LRNVNLTNEIKEIEVLHGALKEQLPELNKELDNLIKTKDENVALLYSRRCLEVLSQTYASVSLEDQGRPNLSKVSSTS